MSKMKVYFIQERFDLVHYIFTAQDTTAKSLEQRILIE